MRTGSCTSPSLTLGTRSGIIHDERYAALLEALLPLEKHLNGLMEAQQRAEEGQATQQLLRAIQGFKVPPGPDLPDDHADGRARAAKGALTVAVPPSTGLSSIWPERKRRRRQSK